MNIDAHVHVFRKAIQANGEKYDVNIVNLFCFTLHDPISKKGENFMKAHPICKFEELEVAIYEQISVHGITSDKVRWRRKGGIIL